MKKETPVDANNENMQISAGTRRVCEYEVYSCRLCADKKRNDM